MSLSKPLQRFKTLYPTCSISCQQVRHATLLRRPKRPYTFTQLVILSDGSSFTQRTTSPVPVYKSRRDSRNTLLWNPSSKKILSVRADEAGQLKAFREKYGQGWDASDSSAKGKGNEDLEVGQDGGRAGGQKGGKARSRMESDNLLDMIGGYGRSAEAKGEAAGVREEKTKSGKGKGGEK